MKTLHNESVMEFYAENTYEDRPVFFVPGDTQPKHIPNCHCVYIIIDKNDFVKYVGQTTSMRQRFRDHKNDKLQPTDWIGWVKCSTHNLIYMESWFIAILRPPLNAVVKGSRKRDSIGVRLDGIVKVDAIHHGASVLVYPNGYGHKISQPFYSRVKRVDGVLVYLESGERFHEKYIVANL